MLRATEKIVANILRKKLKRKLSTNYEKITLDLEEGKEIVVQLGC
jgi:hypothetical protein